MYDIKICNVVVIVFLVIIDQSYSQNHHQKRLYDHLFSNYSKYIRPVGSSTTNNTTTDDDTITSATSVQITLTPLKLLELDEQSQTIHLKLEAYFKWEDLALTWNSSDFGNISRVRYPQSEMWLPPANFYNSVGTFGQLGFDENAVIIESSGLLMWSVFENVRLSCKMDISFYPFDEQTCQVIIQFQYVQRTEINSRSVGRQDYWLKNFFDTGGEWELVDARCYDKIFIFGVQEQSLHTYELILRRRTTFYILSIVLPVTFLSLTDSAVFVLPVDSGEKMGMSITVLLAYSVYLSIIADDLPKTSLQVCYLQVYLTCLLGATALAVPLCVLVIKLHHIPSETAMSPILKNVTLLLGNILWKDTKKGNKVAHLVLNEKGLSDTKVTHSSTDIHQVHPKETAKEDHLDEILAVPDDVTWQLLAETLDRVFFFVFCFITLVGTVILLPYLARGGISTTPGEFAWDDGVRCQQEEKFTVIPT